VSTRSGTTAPQYSVTRAMDGSQARHTPHQCRSNHLQSTTVIAPFRRSFSAALTAGVGATPSCFPVCAWRAPSCSVTNQQGNSPVQNICLTHNHGQRAAHARDRAVLHPGGWVLAVISRGAAAGNRSLALGADVSAVLGSPADAAVQLQVNVNGRYICALSFDPWATTLIPLTVIPCPRCGSRAGDLSVSPVDRTVPGRTLRYHPTLMPGPTSPNCAGPESGSVTSRSRLRWRRSAGAARMDSPSRVLEAQFDWVVVEGPRQRVRTSGAPQPPGRPIWSGLHFSARRNPHQLQSRWIPPPTTPYLVLLEIWGNPTTTENFHRVHSASMPWR